MPSPQPIPVNGITHVGGKTAGSGFLVARGEQVWFVSCIHNLTGLNPTPTSTPLGPAHFQVVGMSMSLPLSLDGSFRTKAPVSGASGSFADAVALKLSATEKAALAHFGWFEADSIISVSAGDNVTVAGFPGLGLAPIPFSVQSRKVEKVHGWSIQLDGPSAVGFSGGPAFNDAGLIGIAYADIGHASNLTNGLVCSLSIAGPAILV